MAIKDYLEHLVKLKNQLAENLTTMGVESHERENLSLLVPKVLMIPKTGGRKTVLFHAGSDVPERYGDKIFTLYQEGIRDLNSHISTGDQFCIAENDYALSYSQADFGWDGQVYTASIEPVTITGSSEIVVTYNCGCIEEGFMCLVPVSGRSESDTIQNYIYTSVANHNYTEVSFGWLQTYGYNTLLYSADNVTPGDYYLCWLGRSDNTHPLIRSVVVYENF